MLQINEMAGKNSEGWRKEIGVAIVPKRGRSAIEEEENKVVCRIPDIPFYGSTHGTHQTSSHAVLYAVNSHNLSHVFAHFGGKGVISVRFSARPLDLSYLFIYLFIYLFTYCFCRCNPY